MSLTAGARLGPYEIVRLLGAGGMGEVYRARDTRLDRDVALKVLASNLAAEPGALARFEREARAVAALSHPNILALFDVGTSGTTAYVVTELLDGETLRARLMRGPCAVSQAIDLGTQVARALVAAHDKNIVHRDLKPENLFLTKVGQVKVLDFGLARHHPSRGVQESVVATEAPGTSPGMILGTVGYMAPEQVRGLATDHRADIFSLGAVLYEALAGRRAFRGDTATDVMAAIVRDEPVDLAQTSASTPAAFARVIMRCLAKSPADRVRSARDLAAVLEALSQNGSTGGAIAQATGADAHSIVVLPFHDLSPEHDNEYFADGLTDEIISDLSKIRDLRVISRASSMQLKARPRDLPTIARELNVRYVLDGSVRKAGPRLRITAQLVDAAADAQVWSEKYNGTIDDVFEIQEQVSRAIVGELKTKLTPDESHELARRPIPDVRAYECYLRARAETQRFSAESLTRALRELEHALQLVGDNVLLLAALGEAYWQEFNLGVTTDQAHLDKVCAIADRIERLDAGSSHVYRLRALAAMHRAQLQQATRLLRCAIELDDTDPFTLTLYSFSCGLGGKSDAAADTVRRLLQIDPLQPLSHLAAAWSQHYLLGEFDAALEGYRRAYEIDARTPMTVLLYATALAAVGRVDTVKTLVDRIERDAPGDRWTWMCQTLKWALVGDAGAVARTLTPELRHWCSIDPQYSLHFAEIHALLAQPDEAFWWLERMLALGACPYPFLAVNDRMLASLRHEARWAPFIERVRKASECFEA